MAFGKRQEFPGVSAAQGSGSKGRVGYAWAIPAMLIALTVSVTLTDLILISGRLHSIDTIMRAALFEAAPSLLMAGALVFPVVDLLLKATARQRPGAYALLCGTGVTSVFLGVMLLPPSNAHPLIIISTVLFPATIGGFVLGAFRSS